MSICLSAQNAIEWLISIDPVALKIGLFEIRWYALAYLLGVLFFYWHIGKVGRFLPERKDFVEALLSWLIVGGILGGRAAYVFIYHPGFYLEFPTEIIKLWHGGMSFHGGVIGALLSMSIVCRRYQVSYLHVLDLFTCAAPLGIFLGRIANLVNGELYGKVTNMCLGVTFPDAEPALTRHPTQVYEAICEGLLPLIFMNALLKFTPLPQRPGVLAFTYCGWYGLVRCMIEIWREPDYELDLPVSLSMGQILSIPMILGSLIMLFIIIKKHRKHTNVSAE
ncbi:prolipoprotein diacylglyceryl transferase [Anaplasma platys]|uniref:Phosphatidylglycerol--prolipoprotein diacylglyceryl transferase n=1 Tax=Anaplasma platys TaxID=949 RepID=A0A858PZG0_9RICK|nr:prolipoprotein diacylglyceryl transferase [Anaplasma platys]QJC27969.1 prolipoprotein diacylglyceryl transferase [Anaplasma platys]